MATFDFDKEFFQRSWGPDGYYEQFSYGVGFNEVVHRCLVPFYNLNKKALEIGCGGGVFTEKMVPRFKETHAIDVIKMPERFNRFNPEKFSYYELPDKCYSPIFLKSYSFAFSYNCFCHLSNNALKNYLDAINMAMNPGGDFVFMLANFEHSKKQLKNHVEYKLGDLLPFGHFYQDERTLNLIKGEGWLVVNNNMIPEHRDLIIHLKKV